jgi:predicted RNA-binding protein with PUA-like domain
MNHWLVKTEPNNWSWADHCNAPKRTTCWDGVRNAQAQLNLKAMAKGDKVFIYHTGKEKQIVGLATVTKTFYPDPTEETGRMGMVDLRAEKAAPSPVTLAQVKADKRFADFLLVRNSRLSVMPVAAKHWAVLCKMAGAAS